jgi:sterol desaturase/sphingolipid hydroxylase (fatty acid hydroxylase superfamily)
LISELNPGQGTARLLTFAGVLLLLALWEWRAELRHATLLRRQRWPTNLGLGALDAVLVRLIAPAGAVGAAMLAARQSFGIFNWAPLPAAVSFIGSLLLLDLTIYAQHRLFHRAPWLWRIHRVHHSDAQLDVSTALRFHPAESLLSMALKAAVAFLFGMPPTAVFAFEILLNAAAMFNHTNVSLGPRWDRMLRWLLVTPDMHRIHHSTAREEADSNYGFSLSWWDHLFRSYRDHPRIAQTVMPIGLPDGATLAAHRRLWPLLQMPVKPAVEASPSERGRT